MNVGFAGTPASWPRARGPRRRRIRRTAGSHATRPAARARAPPRRRRSSDWRLTGALPSRNRHRLPVTQRERCSPRRGSMCSPLRPMVCCCRKRFFPCRAKAASTSMRRCCRDGGAAPIERAILAGDDDRGHDHADGRGSRHRIDARRHTGCDRRARHGRHTRERSRRQAPRRWSRCCIVSRPVSRSPDAAAGSRRDLRA